MRVLVEKRGPGRTSSSRNTPGSSASVNNNGGGQLNHVNGAENEDNAPNNAANGAPHNVLEAGSSAQPVVPALVAAAVSSGGGMREQAVNLVHGVLGELASSTYSISSVSDTVASNMSIVSTRLSRGLISHANLMPMATCMRTSTNTGNVTNVSSVNTSATGLPEGFISHVNLMQMATNLTGTSISGTTTSGGIMGTGVSNIGRSPLISVCSPLGVKLPLSMRAK